MAASLNNPLLFLLKCSLLTLIVVKGTTNSSSVPCPSGHFFDAAESRCKQCSSCTKSHIIKPCSQSSNVECRLYKLAIDKDRNQGHFIRHKINSKGEKKSPAPLNSEINNEDNYWKTLAFALIGLLSVLIIITFIILIFVYKKLQKSIVITQTEEADLKDDADSGYVVIRAIHHMATPRSDNHPLLSLYPRDQTTDSHPPPPHLTSSGPTSIDSGRPTDSLSISTPVPADDNDDNRLCFLPKTYQPQRRLLQYAADDVFESDDNASVNKRFSDPKQKLQTLVGENENNS